MGDWQLARLIPTSGIANDTEAEVRATSGLLAVLSVVRDFSDALLTPLGASSAKKAIVESFIETAFKLGDGAIVRPDGLVRVTYGKSTFTALVEVKTGENLLKPDQINNYIEVARQYDFDTVLTISNEIANGSQHPTDGVKVRANSKVSVAHRSWTEVLAAAVMCKVHRGVDDPEQAWILGELIRYLEHPASGAMTFADMGASWLAVRDGARASTLRKQDAEVRDVVQRWDQLLRFAALRLGSAIGADVQQVLPRSQQDHRQRTAYLTESLCSAGSLDGTLRVPDTVGAIGVIADLRARQVVAYVDVPAPQDRGSKARLTWLLRQLGDDVPASTVIEAWPRHARQPRSAPLARLREDRDLLEDPERRDILRYRLVLRAEMGVHRKAGGKSPGFVDSVVRNIESLYDLVVQRLVPWTPKAPQLRAERPQETRRDTQGDPVATREEAEEALDEAVEGAAAEARDPVESKSGSGVPPLPEAEMVPAVPAWLGSWTPSSQADSDAV